MSPEKPRRPAWQIAPCGAPTFLLIATGVFAQGAPETRSEGPVALPGPRVHAITDVRIVTAPGRVIEAGTIVLRDGLIEAVGPRVTPPADARIIAGEPGWTVYPAFIDAAASVGLEPEPPARSAGGSGPPGAGRGRDESRRRGAPHELQSVRPDHAVVTELDTSHASIQRHRELGFATAQVLPGKGLFRGESALLMLRPGPAPELVLRDRFALVIALETSSFMARQYPSSRMGAVAGIRQVLLDAGRTGDWQARYAANPAGMLPPEYRASDAPLLAALRRERPVVFTAVAGLDPDRFRALATEFNLDAMTVARGLKDRADELKAARMPVLLPLEPPARPKLTEADGSLETPLADLQTLLTAARLPGELDRAGVPLAFVTFGMNDVQKFPAHLAAVVRAGLPAERALAALTTTPAGLLGLSRVMGTLEPGKQANVLVVAGELFSDKPELRHLFVQGHHQDLAAARQAAAESPAGGRGSRPGGRPGAPGGSGGADGEESLPLAAAGLGPLLAVGPYPPPAATSREVLIRNGTVWTMTDEGIRPGTDVLLRDGRIAAIGPDLKARPDALVIDAIGRHVTPGLVDAHSHSATEEMNLNEGVNSISSEVRTSDLLDARSAQIYQQLAGGVTTVQVLHGSGNAIGGQSAVIKYRWGAERPEQLLFSGAPGTIKFALGENPTQAGLVMPGADRRYPATRMGVAALIRSSFERAALYEAEWQRYRGLPRSQQARTVPPRRDLQLEALVEVLNGERDVHAHSYRADEILMLIRLADELGLKIGTFHHVLEGYKVADEMAAHGAGGSAFSDWWSFKMEAYEAIPWNAAIMHERGVLASLNSDDGNLARRLNLEAAKTVRYGGLDPEAAFAMVTRNPARQLRVDHRIGSLAPGMDADVVIWSGDPLSVYTVAEQTFVDGRLVFSRDADRAQRDQVTAAREGLLAALRSPKPATSGDEAAAGAEGASAGAPPATIAVPLPAPRFDYRFAPGVAAGPVAITGATVHTLEGPAIADGVVVFAGGRITAVGGPGTAIPADATRVDGNGRHLWPGIVHLNTVLGISEIDSVAGSVDVAETGDANADADVALAVNAASSHFGVARSAGITHAVVVPAGGTIAGTSSLLRTEGWTWEEMTAVRNHSLVVRWPEAPPPQYAVFLGPPKTPAERQKEARGRAEYLDRMLDAAEAYGRARAEAARTGRVVEFDPQLEALQPVLKGERPLWASAREKPAMEAALDFARQRGLRLVITDARDAYLLLDRLAEQQVPVVLTNLAGEIPRPDDPYDTLYGLPARLKAAGVPFAVASGTRAGGSSNARHLTLFAGLAAAHGLDREEAYRAITLNPARILGLSDVLGSIAPGKSASLVLTDGDLLEQTTTVEQVWIDGIAADLDDMQKQLYRRWSARPRPAALPAR